VESFFEIPAYRQAVSPLFAKEGNYSSLWKREVRRDFINQYNIHDSLVKSLKKLFSVIPVPIFIGINSSRNPVFSGS